jgi:ketosteroid isomerase-like protein
MTHGTTPGDAAGGTARAVDQLFAAWNAHDPAAFAACFVSDGVFEDLTLGTRHTGRPALCAYATTVFELLPDVRMELVTSFADAHHGGAQWRMVASRPNSMQGDPHARFTLQGLELYAFQDGKLAEVKHCWDFRQWPS